MEIAGGCVIEIPSEAIGETFRVPNQVYELHGIRRTGLIHRKLHNGPSSPIMPPIILGKLETSKW